MLARSHWRAGHDLHARPAIALHQGRGSVARVNGISLTVVGVAPYGFTGTMTIVGTDVFLPLAAMERVRVDDRSAPRLTDRRQGVVMLVGRLSKNATAADADAELATLAVLSDATAAASGADEYTYVTGNIGRTSYGTAPDSGGDGYRREP